MKKDKNQPQYIGVSVAKETYITLIRGLESATGEKWLPQNMADHLMNVAIMSELLNPKNILCKKGTSTLSNHPVCAN